MHRRGSSGRFWGRRRGDRGKPVQREQESFHRRNLRTVASPVLLFFSLLRTIAFNLWILLSILICHGRQLLPLRESERLTETCTDAETGIMTDRSPRNRASVPGPGEPILAKQKHHHRKAFEYLSKALKIDEDDAG